ncbi:mediator of RNA polymerase II transcription subunit 15-like [Daphnia carinata]|uniref:mediator of RNA polymerase II transcription subunit 15-like n=1 Tax=Daphnia carinata TaxID=120202 RepID=UPI00257D38A6|nr:mediator of RNA polymerase II transcription subunit 15-like [Daphnia carinata]
MRPITFNSSVEVVRSNAAFHSNFIVKVVHIFFNLTFTMIASPFVLPVIVMLVSIGSIEAVPSTRRSSIENTTSESPPEKVSNIKSRQFNVNVPTGATGLNAGNSASLQQSPLQQLALLQQVTTSSTNPMSIASELEAQKQEAFQLQNQKQQQGLMASVQIQQDQVATAQAAITNQSQMVNGQFQPGANVQAALNPQLQQLQQTLEAQKQQLLVQQQLLQQQVKPEAQQMNKQQILIAQLLNEPPAKRPQLLEQIKQTITKQEAAMMVNPFANQIGQTSLTPTSFAQSNLSLPSRSQQEMQRYQALLQLLSLASLSSNNPNRLGHYAESNRPTMPSIGSGVPFSFGSNAINAQLLQQQQMQQQMLLIQRQQQMMMFQQQMAMMNPFMF